MDEKKTLITNLPATLAATGTLITAIIGLMAFMNTPAPTISSFDASPNIIGLGESSTLKWSVTGASSVTIDPDIGVVALSGSRIIYPNNTTSYVLTAKNKDKETTATLEITVSEKVAILEDAAKSNISSQATASNSVSNAAYSKGIPEYNSNEPALTENEKPKAQSEKSSTKGSSARQPTPTKYDAGSTGSSASLSGASALKTPPAKVEEPIQAPASDEEVLDIAPGDAISGVVPTSSENGQAKSAPAFDGESLDLAPTKSTSTAVEPSQVKPAANDKESLDIVPNKTASTNSASASSSSMPGDMESLDLASGTSPQPSTASGASEQSVPSSGDDLSGMAVPASPTMQEMPATTTTPTAQPVGDMA
jgi:hypothetical protein